MYEYGDIPLNAASVISRVNMAKERAGRFEPVDIIGVTKTVDTERIKVLMSCGIQKLGENRVQELMGKYDALPGAEWHLIGQLQTNKVKYIIDKVCLIHSVDSEKLAEEISKRALKINKIQDILLEINIGNEDTKSGIDPGDAISFSEKLAAYEGIRLTGIMCVAPFVENPENNRALFRKMKQIFVDIADKNIDNVVMKHLSMGMTNDYEVAVEEGSNMVRIGTGFFGSRNHL